MFTICHYIPHMCRREGEGGGREREREREGEREGGREGKREGERESKRDAEAEGVTRKMILRLSKKGKATDLSSLNSLGKKSAQSGLKPTTHH